MKSMITFIIFSLAFSFSMPAYAGDNDNICTYQYKIEPLAEDQIGGGVGPGTGPNPPPVEMGRLASKFITQANTSGAVGWELLQASPILLYYKVGPNSHEPKMSLIYKREICKEASK